MARHRSFIEINIFAIIRRTLSTPPHSSYSVVFFIVIVFDVTLKFFTQVSNGPIRIPFFSLFFCFCKYSENVNSQLKGIAYAQ
jgi:hypothetical protein